MLIVISGLPSTGKSTLADRVAAALVAPVLSVDPIESAILRATIPRSFETGLAAYLVAETIADAHLAHGGTAIIDAVSSVEFSKQMWRDVAVRRAVPLRVIECVCTNETVHRERLARRNRGMAFDEPTWADIERRRAEYVPWRESVLVVDAMEPVEANARRAMEWIRTVAQ